MRAIQITRAYWLTILSFLAVLRLVRSQDTVTVTTIDDHDPAIKYNGAWSPFQSNSVETHNGTLMLSRARGATATYKFNGTGVSVFGTQGPPGGNITVSTYSVDNSSPSQYTVPNGLGQYHIGIEFYSSPPLTEGEHTLIIKNLNDQAWYYLDYIQVISAVGALPPTSTSSDKSSDSTPTPTTGNTEQSKAGISKGVIAGIALAGSALIVLLLLAALWWRRRYLNPTEDDSNSVEDLHPLEEGMMRDSALLEPYQVEQFASSSNITTSTNPSNEKHTYNGVALIRSTENNVDASHSLVDGHASDGATIQYTSEGKDDTSESEPSTSRPTSFSKLLPPYRGASSSPSTGIPPSSPVPQMPPGVATPSSASHVSSSNLRSTDGGVRIAGGPPRTTIGEELDETTDSPILPPAYGTY